MDKDIYTRSPEPLLLEMADRKDSIGMVSRSLKALADIEKHRDTSPATYREVKAHILENLRGA